MGSTHQARSAAIVARIDFPQKVCVNAVQFSERCAPASTESIGSVNGCYGGRIPTSLDVSVDEAIKTIVSAGIIELNTKQKNSS